MVELLPLHQLILKMYLLKGRFSEAETKIAVKKAVETYGSVEHAILAYDKLIAAAKKTPH